MYAATGNTTGLGTFGGQIVGSNFLVKFFPDSGSVEAQAFNQAFYTSSDFDVQPLDLEYGSNVQTVLLSGFDSLNGPRANKLHSSHSNTMVFPSMLRHLTQVQQLLILQLANLLLMITSSILAKN